MANAWYYKAAEELFKGNVDLSTADIRALLIDSGDYTVSLSTHDYLNDIGSSGRVGTAVALTGKSVTNGIFNADDITFPSLSGDSVEAVVLYIHTGTESTSLLLMYLDTGSGFSLTPSGGDVLLTWDNGANKIYKA